MSYGADRNEMFRLAGTYAGKILQGMKPADLPAQAPTKYELVINVKNAKTLKLSIPSALLHRRRGDRITTLFCRGA
jgi:putative ABC transport system substrate-binding protein